MLFAQTHPTVVISLLIVFFLINLAVLLIFGRFFSIWLQAMTSGTPVMLMDLIGMSLRKTDFKEVVQAMIVARHGGATISAADMEKAWIQGVDLQKVTLAMIQANKEGLDLSFQDLVDAELDDRLAEKLGRN